MRAIIRRLRPLLLLAIVAVLATASPAAAQTGGDDESVLVRVGGDVVVPAGEVHGVVVVVDGDLDFAGTADTIVVVNGRAALDAATAETLVVVSGTADLGAGTTITGDVRLADSTLIRDPAAIVEGDIDSGVGSELFSGFWVVGLLFMIGWAILVILGGLLFAAVAPGLARRAAHTTTAELAMTVVAGLVLWIAVPIASIVAFATVIGMPTALTVWIVALPAMAFVGFLVSGVRVGEYITARGEGVGHPYASAFVGIVVLILAGAIPLIGPLVVAVAAFLGSGALALHAVRSIRSDAVTPPAPSSTPAATS